MVESRRKKKIDMGTKIAKVETKSFAALVGGEIEERCLVKRSDA